MSKDPDSRSRCGREAPENPPPTRLTVTIPGELREWMSAIVKADPKAFASEEELASEAVEAVLRGIASGDGMTLLVLGRKLLTVVNKPLPVHPDDLAEFVLGRAVRIPEGVAFEIFLQEVVEPFWDVRTLQGREDDDEIPF